MSTFHMVLTVQAWTGQYSVPQIPGVSVGKDQFQVFCFAPVIQEIIVADFLKAIRRHMLVWDSSLSGEPKLPLSFEVMGT